MLVFSLPSFIIAHLFSKSKHFHLQYYLPLLQHLPNIYGSISNCILVATWFYNQFYIFIRSKSSIGTKSTTSTLHRHYYPSISLHHLLFFIYLPVNCSLVNAISHDKLPIHSLGIIPSLISLPLLLYIHPCQQHHPPLHKFLTPNLPLIHSTSTNSEKLCYLSA